MLGVDERDDAVQAQPVTKARGVEKGLRDRGRIGQPARFDEDPVGRPFSVQQVAERFDEVLADGTADAPAVGRDQALHTTDDQILIDTDLAGFVLDDRDAKVGCSAQDAVEQGRLAGTEIARQNGDRNLAGRRHEDYLNPAAGPNRRRIDKRRSAVDKRV